MLEPGTAVILDTETTDLLDPVVIEIAVIDAATGATLLDTLVDPGGAPINPEATTAVHGLSETDLVGAPPWALVLPQLALATQGRTVLAYNAEFSGRDPAGLCRSGGDPEHLVEATSWGCLMDRRADWTRAGWRGLGGSHRALGDCRAAREVLVDIAQRPTRIGICLL